jgi:hypothetical protein
LKASVVLAISVTIAVAVPLALDFAQIKLPSFNNNPVEQANSNFGYFNGSKSTIQNTHAQAVPIQLYQTPIVPEVHGYHHITYASVERQNQSSFLFTIGLAGDPNQNDKYETSYRWHLLSSNSHLTEQEYTIIIPNFANNSAFPSKGWYYAIFNNTSGSYIIPMSNIGNMPHDRVELPVNAAYLGDPIRFYYSVSVAVRVNTTSLDREPDYLMDVAP